MSPKKLFLSCALTFISPPILGMDTLRNIFGGKPKIQPPLFIHVNKKPVVKAQKLETEPECVSCYENTDEPLMSLDCDPRHRFHVSCISTWFGKNKTCPTCRQPAVSLDETKIFFWEKIKSGRIKPAEIFNEVESMSVLARLKRFELKDQNEMLIKEKDNYKQLYESEKKSYKNLDRKYYEEQAEWSQKNALLKIQRNAILITCGIGICFLGYKRIFSK